MRFKIQKTSYSTIIFSAMVTYIGFYAWRIMFNNFAVEVFDASPTDVGLIQAAREIPGLLAFGAGALAVYLSESRIASFSIVTVGLGLILCGLSPSIAVLGIATVLMSFGFHYFEPTNSSQLLNMAKSEELGRAQGRLRSYEAIAGLVGAALIFGLSFVLDYRYTFYLIGFAIVAIGIYLIFALPTNRAKTEKRKIKIKRKYWLYYTLSFLRGCRRHIFTTFAIFLLVKNHGLDIAVVSAIMFSNNAIMIFTNSYLGYLSDRFGERVILAGCSFLLVFIFVGYAFISYLPFLIGLYLIDNILFSSSIALKSYLRKISTKEDITSCLSFGMTANHITAIFVPIAGGVAWKMFGFQATFLAGAVIVFIDMLFALLIPKNNNSEKLLTD